METVIETPAYLAAAADAGMTEAEREAAVLMVATDPMAGAMMVGTGGCRKVRLAGKGKGKSGGYRLITFYRTTKGVYLLWVFSKGSQSNLNDAQKVRLKKSLDGL